MLEFKITKASIKELIDLYVSSVSIGNPAIHELHDECSNMIWKVSGNEVEQFAEKVIKYAAMTAVNNNKKSVKADDMDSAIDDVKSGKADALLSTLKVTGNGLGKGGQRIKKI